MTARRLAWLVPASLLAIVAVGCGDDAQPSDGTSDEASTEADGAEQPEPTPGVPLAENLVTPPDTALVSAPFASQGSADDTDAVDVTIDAVLQVTGDPAVAFADLLDQAEAAGIEMRVFSSDDPAPCVATDSPSPTDAGERLPLGAADDLPEGERAVECDAFGRSDGADGTQRELQLTGFVSERTDPYLSAIRLAYTEYDGMADESWDYLDGYLSVGPLEGESPIEPPPAPPASSLPEPGDRLGEPFVPDGEDYRLRDGSRQLLPVLPPECLTGGFVAVLHAEEGLDEAFEAYDEQVRQGFGTEEPDASQAFEHRDVEYHFRSYSAAGGGDMELWATGAPDGGTFLLLDRCND